MSKDLNKVLESQIKAMIEADAHLSELQVIDANYLLTIKIEKVDEEE